VSHEHTANGSTTMTTAGERKMTETPSFMPQEVAYRFPGKAWKRRTIRTQKAFDGFLAKLDGDAEVHTRDAD
jgi:hypothetical protein